MARNTCNAVVLVKYLEINVSPISVEIKGGMGDAYLAQMCAPINDHWAAVIGVGLKKCYLPLK